MSETTTSIPKSKVWLSCVDGAGTKSYSFRTIGPPTRELVQPREHSVAFSQTGGSSNIHAASQNGVNAVGKLKFTVYTQDLANSDAASANQMDTLRQSYDDTATNYWSGMTSTNPLVGGNRRMLDWIDHYNGVGAAGANVTSTAAGYVSKIGEEKEVNGHMAVDIEVDIVESWIDA